jgi:chemotaxis protein methyltransferase CheR
MGVKKIKETTTEVELVAEVSRVVSEVTGIQLGAKQSSLVQSRLAKRFRELKIAEPLDYARYYNANENIEAGVLVSLLTTHHTYFFREFQHFEFLLKITIPKLIRTKREQGQSKIRIWSSACSRGQEVYSLVMFLNAHLKAIAPDMEFEILGSDICEESIAIARNGVYGWDELRSVPSVYLQGNWVRGTGSIVNFVRAKETIRHAVSFKIINLQELDKLPFGSVSEKFDIIFVRNVFIYFAQSQISKITAELIKLLSPHGQMFVGLSESLNGLGLPIEWVGPSVYEQRNVNLVKLVHLKTGEKEKPSNRAQTEPLPDLAPEATLEGVPGSVFSDAIRSDDRKIRVLCVDDSATVLLLLKRIFNNASGFELVGTACDGVEAAEKVKALKPDVVTLDIHMPRMSGVEFLEKYFHEIRTPVVIVSSVPRDDAGLAYRCLELGASDYIEKPSTANLDKVEEELLFKLRVADDSWRQNHSGVLRSRALELDASFRRPPLILNPNGKLRVIIANFSSRDVLAVLLRGFQGPQPATLVLLEGAGDVLEAWIQREGPKAAGGKSYSPGSLKELVPGTVYFVDFQRGLRLLRDEGAALIKSTMALGPLNRPMIDGIRMLATNHLILEDRGVKNPASLLTKANLILPLTSFVYESNRYLADTEAPKPGGGR